MCSGKVYFDLLDAREKTKNDTVVYIRVEELKLRYLSLMLKKYKNAEDIVWAQEEREYGRMELCKKLYR